MGPVLHVACMCCRLEAELAGLPGIAAADASADQRTAQATVTDPGTSNMDVAKGRKRARDADDDGHACSSGGTSVLGATAPKRERRR